MNKPVYLGLSILEISKMVKYEFQYDYMKAKYGEKVKLCFMDTGSFIAYIKTEDIFSDIVQDAETRFDTTNFELDRPLSEGKCNNIIAIQKMINYDNVTKEDINKHSLNWS